MEKEKSNSKFGIGLLVGLTIGLFLAAGLFVGVKVTQVIISRYTGTVNDNVLDAKTLKKMQNIQKMINSQFYKYNDEVTTEKMEDGVFEGMLESLNDPYAEYISPTEMEETLNGYEGISYGIGCYISMGDDNLAVISGLIEGSPAEKADIREGDIIVMVDGESVLGLSLSEVVAMVKGPIDTEVEITFDRDGEEVVKKVTRGELIETVTVDYGTIKDNDNIGYIRIREFDNVTLDQYNEAMDELRDSNIEGLILDLRSNPGGDFETSIEIAREIIPEGLVVYTEDSKGRRKEFSCDGKNELDIPLTVLINEYSASASEVLAGAIKDHNKATLIGTTTFGKGIVQTFMPLGDDSGIKFTTSAYFTPNGTNIHGVGIEPDIELEYDYDLAKETGDDNQVRKAIEVLKQEIGEK